MAAQDKGKGKTIYVGNLAEEINSTSLHSAFTPFGEIIDVQIPHDPSKRDKEGSHKGFGFVEFAAASDAADAVDNMHLNKLAGRVLKVNLARPLKGQQQLGTFRAVWEDEAWLAEHSKPLNGAPQDIEAGA